MTRRPEPVLLADGGMLVPIQRGDAWTLERIDPDHPHYVGWLQAYQQLARDRPRPEGVGVEIAFAVLIPPIAVILAIVRFARDEVGPGLALLLSGWVGAGLYAAAWTIYVAARVTH
jgi:hypothetical protein